MLLLQLILQVLLSLGCCCPFLLQFALCLLDLSLLTSYRLLQRRLLIHQLLELLLQLLHCSSSTAVPRRTLRGQCSLHTAQPSSYAKEPVSAALPCPHDGLLLSPGATGRSTGCCGRGGSA